jgi:hypothetical protein
MQRMKYLGKVCPFIDQNNKFERWLPGEEKVVGEGHAERLVELHPNLFKVVQAPTPEVSTEDKMVPSTSNKMGRAPRNKSNVED